VDLLFIFQNGVRPYLFISCGYPLCADLQPLLLSGPSLEDFSVLQKLEDVFQEITGLPPRREKDFSIYLLPGAALVSKTPYRMSIPELK
jgi:hypothetical protein